ncbi:MAG: methyl-accepting chemotaxis protein [Azoarcus sp.]|jgi:methyl-accepting chemotaxis protein|nr:methyl-accepting chemotaxis protein [Azoarcus sp.]
MVSKTSFSDWPIATKLNVIQLVALAVSFAVAITWMSRWLTETTIEDNTRTVQQINHQIVNMIRVFNNNLESRTVRLSAILKNTLPSSYTLDTTQRVAVAGAQTPVLSAGNEVLNLNFAVIDRFAETSAAIGTIFVRDGNEFIRVTTSLVMENGERAIGTKLAQDHPAYAALLANKTYTGKAVLFHRDYMTHYVPVQDASGAVVGALFTGLEFTDELAKQQQNIREIVFGGHGYMYVLEVGNNTATMIVHPTLEGKNVYDEKDAAGRTYFRDIVEQKEGVQRYRFVDPTSGNTSSRERVAVFESIPEWKWIIVSSLDREDLAENAVSVRNNLIIGAIALCALLFTVVFIASRRWVARPLSTAVDAMEQIARGSLNITIPEHGNDEVGRLLTATSAMAQNMRSALHDIQNAAQQLADSSEHLVSTSNEVASQSAQQSDSATAMASSIEEMSANIIHVSDSAKQANQVSLDSDQISNEGSVVIQQATDSMTHIADTVRAASEAVSTLGKESQAISAIVNVISEIAEQTNLLALNAAIEAARAGEQGRGFAVVADEVRKLAERTSSSTQEISSLIRRVLDGTTNAVASMEEGVRQVEEGVSYASQAGGSIASIRQSASQVTEAVTSISHALAEQSAAVSSISDNIEKIASMADQNSQIAKGSAQCAAELEQLAHSLQENISHFNI